MSTITPLDRLRTLAPRQREVLALVCKRHGYKQIAEALTITESAVKGHMTAVYRKLGLEELDRDQRIIAIHTQYCPLLAEMEGAQSEPVEPELEPEPLTPAQEEMLAGDEKALVLYKPLAIEPIPKPKPKVGGWLKALGGLLFVGLVTWAGWQGWQFLQSTAATTEALDEAYQPPDTEVPVQASETPTGTSEPVVAIDSATETPSETPVPEEVHEIGEWHQAGDVWLRLQDYEVDDRAIYFLFEIWNQTNQEIFFHWEPLANIFLRDNTGFRFPVDPRYDLTAHDERVPAGTRAFVVAYPARWTTAFKPERLYQPGVTELFLTVEYFSRVEHATWRIEIGK